MAYTAQAGSPSTTLAANIASSDTSITVTDGSAFSGLTLPNLLTIGYTRNNFETVKVTAINGNTLTVVRNQEGGAQSWNSGTEIARVFTALDWNGLITEVGNRTKMFTASCSTAAGTSAKVATLDDDTGFELSAGVMVAVRFTYGNSATTPTLRVDGSNVGTGTAKTIAIPSSVTAFTTGNGTTYNTWGARETILFTYTGTYWTHLPSGYLGYLAYNLANGKQASITASGILKGDGSGGVSAAAAGTDYQAPMSAGTNIDITSNQITAKGLVAYDATFTSSGWSTSGSYKVQTVNVTGLAASYPVSPIVDVVLSGSDATGDKNLVEGFALISLFTTASGQLTAKCVGDNPTVNIPVKVLVWE